MATSDIEMQLAEDWTTDEELRALGLEWYYHEHCGEVCFQDHSEVAACEGELESPCPHGVEWDCSPTSDGKFSCVHLIEVRSADKGASSGATETHAAADRLGNGDDHIHGGYGKRTARAWDRNTYEMISRGKKWQRRPARPPR